ncbi:MAG: T9SS type A sorting domain-containing protein [Flavobacteriales bacterium]|nr:T9SS type A sorting domain-containing protein [Flavobacteriales bacterium]
MKRLFTALLFIIITISAFSQAKHITFKDSVLVDVNGFVSVYNYKINSIPTTNDYFVVAPYADGLYTIKYYLAKLNFQGEVVFDTLIEFAPLSSMAYPAYVIGNEASSVDYTIFTAVENSDFKYQPMIAKFDLYGNHLWNKYYEIDTLNFDPIAGFTAADGGYVSYGRVNDWGALNMNYILKVDALGNTEWCKFYGDKDPSAMEYSGDIKVLNQTPDNGYLFASLVSTDVFNPTESMIKLTKIDATGNIEWSKGMRFNAPIDNVMDGGTEVKSLTILDVNNALLSVVVNDTVLSTRRFGLINLNPITGDINWKKSYYLGVGEGGFYVNKIFQSPSGDLVGYYDNDNYGSVLFKMNTNGEMLDVITHQELPIGMGTTYYQDIDNTEDGGVIIAADRYNGGGFMLFKTDEKLNTNCPESNVFSLPTEDTLGFDNYTFLDTVYSVVMNENSLTVNTPSNSVESTNDTYCSCIIDISGNIDYASNYADSVNVVLYKISETGEYIQYANVETDAAGYYQFLYLPEGEYVVKAIPSPTKYPNYLPTYFLFTSGTTKWNEAFVNNLMCGSNPIPNNISLIEKLPQVGSWQCSGYVFELAGYGNRLSSTNSYQIMAPGDPLSDIDITIDQSPGGAISSATTDVNGFFHFTGLNNNATFILRADLPGFPNDSIYTFTVNPGDGALDSLNFYIGSDSVYILPQGMVGINVFETKDFDLDIIPNPTKDNFVLELTSLKKASAELILTSSIGTHVLNKKVDLNVGLNKVDFDFNSQSAGIYFMIINIGNEHYFRKIVKQ